MAGWRMKDGGGMKDGGMKDGGMKYGGMKYGGMEGIVAVAVAVDVDVSVDGIDIDSDQFRRWWLEGPLIDADQCPSGRVVVGVVSSASIRQRLGNR
ncbi:hypothetical protein VC83_04956 [Pseudogymnoascus destructans]|uniref:Uncharacterized protein n=1 Tax=Pseudogymnoascus destructans TaxID=655981 RepID=A0A177A9D8_9PEZI|nr:uncharacterized protein VC83_04956 [Pseudogymnoascus destructans]OAF58726.1 hypothetical protein VC83_04956 [Pseudogymnoascus destructans]